MMGISFPAVSIPINTIIQMVIPKEKLGRVLSAFAASFIGSNAVGATDGRNFSKIY